MPITLEQLLAARDARAAYTDSLRRRVPGACIGVFTVVSPGPVKRSPDTIRLFFAGIDAIGRMLLRYELAPLLFETHQKETGDEAYLAIKTQPGFLKTEFCRLEESAAYGRLWDMDVIAPDGKHIDRVSIGCDERCCIVCGRSGRACFSRRLHSPKEVSAAVQALMRTLPGEKEQ